MADPAQAAAAGKTEPDIPTSVREGRYKVGRRLGTGGFGFIHEATDSRRGNLVAIKFEPKDATPPQVCFEANAYVKISGDGMHNGVPQIYWFGTEGEWTVMVMQRLGHSLEGLKAACGGRLSLKSVCMVADQALTRLERVHAVGLIHRDIKPDNFLMGLGDQAAALYLVDFGLARPYVGEDGAHLPFAASTHNAGTVRYASIGMQKAWLQSRRDDLEALSYVLLYLAKGRLPWQGLSRKLGGKARDAEVLRLKTETPEAAMAAGLPAVFGDFIGYCRRLEFEGRPDYRAWRRHFREACEATGATYDGVYDWTGKDVEAALEAARARGRVPPPRRHRK